MSDTGHRCIFLHHESIKSEGITSFVTRWLDWYALDDAWLIAEDQRRQLSLFYSGRRADSACCLS